MTPHTLVDRVTVAGPLEFRPRRLAALMLSMQRAMPGWDLYGYCGRAMEALLGAAARARREAAYWAEYSNTSKTAAALAEDYRTATGLLEQRAARTPAGRIELGLDSPVWEG